MNNVPPALSVLHYISDVPRVLGVQCQPLVCQCMFVVAVRAQLSRVVAPRVRLSAVLAQGVVEHAQQSSASSELPWS